MALNIKIDFDTCYDTEPITEDLRLSRFNTELSDQSIITIGVSIKNEQHPLLPDVYNLAFGPMDAVTYEIDDQAKITHADHSKAFSTIIFSALTFLTSNPNKYLGIDGSNNARAYLYYRIIQNNYDMLTQYFDIYGVKYYVRILRKANDADENYPADTQDIKALPTVLKKGEQIVSNKMFNYFIFKTKEVI